MNNKITLSIIIPTLNEADRLPLLLADISVLKSNVEVLIIDGGSKDVTMEIAKLSGAKAINFNRANRGAQLNYGASISKGEWILFLHADSRLPNEWTNFLKPIIQNPIEENNAWYFDFKLSEKGFLNRCMEFLVNIRSIWLQRPYGDQGLLIRKDLYNSIGGYKDLHIMEDLEFIERVSKTIRLKRIGTYIYTNYRQWKKHGVINQAWTNLLLRNAWRRGVKAEILSKKYYKSK